jgi:hypothetical protein
METFAELLRQNRIEEIWHRYCGFLDLDTEAFMAIQERLLMEQLEKVGRSRLGQIFLGAQPPQTLAEFRQRVRLTTYQDYEPYLQNQNDEYLAEKPVAWARTSGRAGKPKWIPYTQRAMELIAAGNLTALILCAARRRGEVRIEPRDVMLHNTPARPYSSGWAIQSLATCTDFRFLPPLETSEAMTFGERIRVSFQMALHEGIDVMGSLSSVLVRIGDSFAESTQRLKFNLRLSKDAMHPVALVRMGRAWLTSRLQGRKAIKPRDLWKLKGMVVGGMDTSIYKEKLIDYWGVEPHESYGATEAPNMATQAWTRKGLYFLPDIAFYEFIPESEWARSRADPTYLPQTVLLNEVQVGQRYEVVITNFHGGPLLRYRMHDLVRVVADGEPKAGIRLPSIVFEARDKDLIDLASFSGPMDEKQIWTAVVKSGIPHEEWAARKEVIGGHPTLHLYIEPKVAIHEEEARQRLHEALKEVNPDYGDIETLLGFHPLRVTLLPPGSFMAYMKYKAAQGADLAHLKPPHMNAPDEVMEILLNQRDKGRR